MLEDTLVLLSLLLLNLFFFSYVWVPDLRKEKLFCGNQYLRTIKYFVYDENDDGSPLNLYDLNTNGEWSCIICWFG